MASMKFLIFLLIFVLLGDKSHAQDQTVNVPRIDISGWIVKSNSVISVSISDQAAYYLGYDFIYQNPKDKNQFMRQIRVFVPFTVVKSTRVSERSFTDMAVSYVTDAEEKDMLNNYLKNSDPIVEIYWQEKADIKRGTNILDGDHQVWFFNAHGDWIYERGAKVKTLWTGKEFNNLDGQRMIVGLKLFLSDLDYFAHEIPHSYIELALKARKADK